MFSTPAAKSKAGTKIATNPDDQRATPGGGQGGISNGGGCETGAYLSFRPRGTGRCLSCFWHKNRFLLQKGKFSTFDLCQSHL
jgi:hypothetical protein